MKGYSVGEIQDCAYARVEGVNVSYRDLTAVCASIRNLDSEIAMNYLALASEGRVPVYFARHNKNMGHRRELGGKIGRYPQKAAGVVMNVLKSAMANAGVKGINGTFVLSATANKKHVYPRLSSKGRLVRSNLETARVEIVLGSTSLSTEKKDENKKEKSTDRSEKKTETKDHKHDKSEKSESKSSEKTEEKKKDPHDNLKSEQKTTEHKHEMEKTKEHEKKHEEKLHHHGEFKKDTKNR